ncbi:MAG: hypothetical protein V4492_08335 [Chlamydiota bacterium]
MKHILAAVSLAAAILAGCESSAGTGALVGGGVGVGAGALISGTPQGALIGGAAGAVGGALIGAAVDSSKETSYQESPRKPSKEKSNGQLSMEDIKRMTQAGVTDDKIISTIQSTGSVFYLSSSDIADLKKAHVSQRVIDFMLQTPYE